MLWFHEFSLTFHRTKTKKTVITTVIMVLVRLGMLYRKAKVSLKENSSKNIQLVKNINKNYYCYHKGTNAWKLLQKTHFCTILTLNVY